MSRIFILCFVTKSLVYSKNICTYNIHKNKASLMLQDSPGRHNLQVSIHQYLELTKVQYRGADKPLVRQGKKQANISVRMA